VKVAHHMLDAFSSVTPVAGDHAHFAAGVSQQRDHGPPQPTGAADDQNPCCHGSS
jgi:hypothetical protein